MSLFIVVNLSNFIISYQFNCGEGCQRLANEHKMKLSKLSHIFITHSSWDNMGGLPGMALTLQEMGIPQLSIYGPKSLVTNKFHDL